MVSRNNDIIRHDINMLNELVSQHSGREEALAAIVSTVSFATEKINTAWKSYKVMAVLGEKERRERDIAIQNLMESINRWLPEIMAKAPEINLVNIPNNRAIPEDFIRFAEDIIMIINSNKSNLYFAESTVQELTQKLNSTKKEISEAQAIMPLEAECRNTYTEACIDANAVLKMSLDIVRTVFGRTSPEYKQFLAHNSSKEYKGETHSENYATE